MAGQRSGTLSYVALSRSESRPAVVAPDLINIPGGCIHSTDVMGDVSLRKGRRNDCHGLAVGRAQSPHLGPEAGHGVLLPKINASHVDMHVVNPFERRAQCRYPCIEPLLPDLQHIISPNDACDLLESFFAEQRLLCFRCTSPYMLTNIMRSESVLHPANPRPMSPALLAVILWAASKTADLKMFDRPGARYHVIDELHRLSLGLIKIEDPDNYFRSHGTLRDLHRIFDVR
jgi:hypothetical protein